MPTVTLNAVSTCTWKHCKKPAAHPQTATDGEVWANLCDQHSTELEAAIGGSDAKLLLRLWVMAGGGAEKMGARMTPGIKPDLSAFFGGAKQKSCQCPMENGFDRKPGDTCPQCGGVSPSVAAGMRGTADTMEAVGKPAPAMAAQVVSNPPIQREDVPQGNIHPSNPMSPRRLTAAARRLQVMDYKLLGASERQIAEKLHISQGRVHQILVEELQKQSETTRLATDQYRQIHLNVLEKMEFGLMQQATSGDGFAVDRILRIQQQRERILPGLVIPLKVAAGVGGLDSAGEPSGGAAITIMMTPAEMEVPVEDATEAKCTEK